MSITDELMYKAGESRLPISGVFELTPMCNFSCKMCYVRKSRKEVTELGGLQDTQQWLKWAKQAYDAGMLYLLFTGGEPLSYPGFFELYESCHKMGIIISINSNGSLIDEACARKFSELPPRKINITLYGASKQSYERLCGSADAFERVMRATELLDQYGVSYKFNCSLTKYNCHELQAMQEIARSKGVPLDMTAYMFPPVRRDDSMFGENDRLSPQEAGRYTAEGMYMQLGEEIFEKYAEERMAFQTPPPLEESLKLQEEREMACRAGRCSFWLNWQGKLSACGMLEKPAVSLLKQPFALGWKQIVEETNRIRVLAGCAGCPNRTLCHVCISSAWCETGDIHGRPEYQCRMAEAEAKACGELLHKRRNGG